MDLEGYAKRLIRENDERLSEKMIERISEIKRMSETDIDRFASAVLAETKAADAAISKGGVFACRPSGVTMGAFGIGSRGTGDFYAHERIGKVIGKTGAVVDSSDLDDSGVVSVSSGVDGLSYVVVTVDGMHSRLSSFPFLSGFHAARAALRDVYTMGARPSAMLSDVHIADDGDVSMLFDHIAGIAAVGELAGVPLVTGSTLRIGGDMVIGDRMTGCVGAVGVLSDGESLTSRNKTTPGDVILMTRGAGGGTVTATAIYSGYEKAEDVVEQTLNVDFLTACDALIKSGLHRKTHALTDVTNGGIRGDAAEISKKAGVRLVFDHDALIRCVRPDVLTMFEKLGIDPLGVSIDALLIICPKEAVAAVSEVIGECGVFVCEVGRVEEGAGAVLIRDGAARDFSPLFRESAYTPIKKVVGERTPDDFDAMKKAVDRAVDDASEKKNRIIDMIRRRASFPENG